MRITRCQLGLAAALSALAIGVHAQQPAGTAAPPSTTTASPAHARAQHATKKHATAHHAMRHGKQTSAEATGTDTAYKAALRRCVTGPESARDSCLDQAISQYGRA